MSLLTEQEAAGSFCPQTINKISEGDGDYCHGSLCMAWRWGNGREHWQKFHKADNRGALTEAEAGPKPADCKGWEFMPAYDDSAGWREPAKQAEMRRRGYCGLAGVPGIEHQIEQVIDVIARER